MPEFLAWVEFFKLHPFDDRSRYYRPAALIAHSMGGADFGEMTSFLAGDVAPVAPPLTEEGGHVWTAAELKSFKAHGITPPKRK